MSKQEFQRFIQAAKSDFRLNEKFNKLVAEFARKSGFDVTADDVNGFIDDLPAERTFDPVEGDMPSVTLAVGEEDGAKKPPRRPGPGNGGTMTTFAVGEEENGRMRRPGPR